MRNGWIDFANLPDLGEAKRHEIKAGDVIQWLHQRVVVDEVLEPDADGVTRMRGHVEGEVVGGE